MLRKGNPIGVILIRGMNVRPLTENQTAFLKDLRMARPPTDFAKPSTMNALEFVVLVRMALIAFMSAASAQPCAFSLLWAVHAHIKFSTEK